ncbi:MAG: deoxynucleoside kinase [Candidatus Carbobacillus sp.]|nr:deoxynucleoside kinase [Candidatus Carbobacillus sp.]
MNTDRMKRGPLISIAGMVGVGKTSLAKTLAETLGYQLSMEKVDDHPYLDDYYEDFKRWSFHVQIFFLAERFKEHQRIFHDSHGYVQDRTIYEDVDIFARLQYEAGNLSERDYHTYRSLFEAMTTFPYFAPPDLVIYLRGDLDTIIRRIQKRGRPMELKTPLQYWEMLYNRYETWIRSFNRAPLLIIDISEYDLFNDHQRTQELIQRIQKHLNAKRLQAT